MTRSLLFFVTLLAAAALPARASQPAQGAAPAIDPDATCLITVGMAGARFGDDPSFMGADHDRAIATMREAVFFYGGRLTLHHEGQTLDRVMMAADTALPRDQWMGLSATCVEVYSAAIPGLGRALEQALAAAGVRRDGPQPPPTPADAASLDPDLVCVAIFVQARQEIARQGTRAPASATAALPTLGRGTVYYSARALVRLPADTRGALFATTLRSIRDDQRTPLLRQCASRMNSEMGRISRAAAAAGALERASPHPTGQ